MDTIIFDIDGTLADVGHRRHHVRGGNKDWIAFNAKMVDDPPHRDVCLLAELLGDHPLVNQGAIKLFLFSGRSEDNRAQTEKWLLIHARSYFQKAEALLMRAEGDTRADTIVKKEMLDSIQAQGHEVRFVVDDRPSVIAMWKANGITVLQHDDGGWETERTWSPGELHMMIGPSGAGKSIFVQNTYGPLSAIVSSDELRQEITGDFRSQLANDQVFKVMHALVRARVEGGLETWVDSTNLRAKDRRALRDLCPSNTDIHYHVIDRPLADKHRDAGWRGTIEVQGEPLIEYHHKRFQSGLKHILNGDGDSRVTVHDHRSGT